MVEKTIKKIAKKLELFASSNISITRALDILEASTEKLEELIAINTMRESFSELKQTKTGAKNFQPIFPMDSEFGTSNIAAINH